MAKRVTKTQARHNKLVVLLSSAYAQRRVALTFSTCYFLNKPADNKSALEDTAHPTLLLLERGAGAAAGTGQTGDRV